MMNTAQSAIFILLLCWPSLAVAQSENDTGSKSDPPSQVEQPEAPPIDDNPYRESSPGPDVESSEEPSDIQEIHAVEEAGAKEELVEEVSADEIAEPGSEKEAAAVAPMEGENVEVVVWIGSASEEIVGFSHFSEAVTDAGFVLALETVEGVPTASMALEIMLSHRAVAVVWHESLTELRVLFREEGTPEMITTSPGDPKEEALYLKELLLNRTGKDSVLSSYLVTVPGEFVVGEGSTGPATPKLEKRIPRVRNRVVDRRGWKVGVGYVLRVHSDTVLWWQHGLRLHIPVFRASNLVSTGIVATVGFPSQIGETGVQWMEIRSYEGAFSIGVVPLRKKNVEFMTGIRVGLANYSVVSFLSNGHTETHSHLTGLSGIGAAFTWYPFEMIGIRAHVEGTYIFGPPSYSINGNGEFGEFPWIPGGGLDLIVALSKN